jgi:multiple sugar transport system ATP-binding protein
MGLRPEHMDGGQDGAPLVIECETLEPLGAHTLLLGRISGTKAVAQVEPRFPAQPGQPCTVRADMAQVHFFDAETELRL